MAFNALIHKHRWELFTCPHVSLNFLAPGQTMMPWEPFESLCNHVNNSKYRSCKENRPLYPQTSRRLFCLSCGGSADCQQTTSFRPHLDLKHFFMHNMKEAVIKLNQDDIQRRASDVCVVSLCSVVSDLCRFVFDCDCCCCFTVYSKKLINHTLVFQTTIRAF